MKKFLLLLLLFCSIVGIFLRNEYRALSHIRTVRTRSQHVQPVVGAQPWDVVRVQWDMRATRGIVDDVSWLLFNDIVALRATVQMYQYTQHVREDGYIYYVLDRHSVPIDHTTFVLSGEYVNHPFSLQSYTLYNQYAEIGWLALDPALLTSLDGRQPQAVMASRDDLGAWLYERSVVRPDAVYIGIQNIADPDNPVVGDIRLTYESLPFGDVVTAWILGQDRLGAFVYKDKTYTLTAFTSESETQLARDSLSLPKAESVWILRLMTVIIIRYMIFVFVPVRRWRSLPHLSSFSLGWVVLSPTKKQRWSVWITVIAALSSMVLMAMSVSFGRVLVLLCLLMIVWSLPRMRYRRGWER